VLLEDPDLHTNESLGVLYLLLPFSKQGDESSWPNYSAYFYPRDRYYYPKKKMKKKKELSA